MSDIKIVWHDFSGGIAVKSADLLHDDSMKSAVIISLFTDRLANVDDVLPDPSMGRKGWWADSYANNDLIGSRLWLLNREKQVNSVLERAREYALEALQWLIDQGIAQSVNVVVSNPRQGFLVMEIQIDKPQYSEQYQFNALWETL